MAEPTEILQDAETVLFDEAALKATASAISEVMFDWHETSTMERKIHARLLEQVSRILHRCEEMPSRIREAEDALMHMDEPELGIALLRQYFLIRSSPTEECVVKQLVRLAESPDPKTSELTRSALKEAAYSETPRLQSLGCKALFQLSSLSEEELLSFAQSREVLFEHRLEAVHRLVERQSRLGPVALVDVVKAWGKLPEDGRRKFTSDLFKLAGSFEQYAALDGEFVESIIEKLFSAADDRGLENVQKKFIQKAMAALPANTVSYLRLLEPKRLGSPAVIYALGACARRSTIGTMALLEHGKRLLEEKWNCGDRSRALEWIAEQVEGARHENDPDIHGKLDELIEAVQWDSDLENADKILTKLRQARESWKTGGNKGDLKRLLKQIAKDLEEGLQDIDRSDAWDLRRAFEREYTRVTAAELSPTEREALVLAMAKTAEQSPWNSSAHWLMNQYPHFEGDQRIIIQDTLGYVALGEKRDIETKLFRKVRQFFEECCNQGSSAERQHASGWLDRLVGEKLPAAK